ncbi:MAG TPA: DUF2243 domain-containing protein [Longimicrobium sp.]
MTTSSASRRAGIVIGIGMGGFVDGILLHQILEWHNMGSWVLPPTSMEAMRQNMVWDGAFHAGTWVITLAGIYLLLADARRGTPLPSPRAFTGQLLLGWGGFNVVEGIIDHHLLNLHHVRDLPVHIPLYDWLFLAVAGVGFLLLGRAMSREPRTTAEFAR